MYTDDGYIEHVIASAVVDKNYNVSVADEEIYAFFGERVLPSFTLFVHNDDRERFIEAVNACKDGKEHHVFVRLKNYKGDYCTCVIIAKQSDIDVEKFIQLNIYDVVYLVDTFNEEEQKIKKIAYTMKLLNPPVVFDYTVATGVIIVYGDRDNVIFKGDIDDFYKIVVRRGWVDKAHVSGLYKLIEAVKRGKDGASAVLNLCVEPVKKKVVPMLVRTSNIYDKESAAPVTVVGVITSEEQGAITTENIYKNRSNLDPLTGLYNKAAIKEMAIDALANSDGDVITYVMLDLDHFKEVNDTYGHMFGDEVILNAARIIKEIVGKKGDVGRVGGDEFFIVLKGVGSDLEELRPVLRAIRSQIEWAYKGKLGGIKLTTSIGCASSPKDALNYDDLFKLADRCLYIAKAKGRNRFIIYTREIHGSLEEIMSTDNSIKIGKKVSDSQRLEFVTDAVTRLSDWGESVVNSVIKDMMKYFDVDRIVVYDVEAAKAISSAVPIEDANENICTYFDSFKEAFRETNTLYYGDSVNLKMPYPEFYDYVQRHEFLSLFVYSIKNKGEITHLAVAYTKGHYEKWSDVSVNYLSILFKTIGDKVIAK